MSDKTLCEVAYEAWRESMHENPHRCCIKWEGGDEEALSDRHRAWQAAAEAVIEHYLTTETEAPLDFIKYRHEVRAVIEAAKALLVDDGTRLHSRIDRIVNATHALLEQELGKSDE